MVIKYLQCSCNQQFKLETWRIQENGCSRWGRTAGSGTQGRRAGSGGGKGDDNPDDDVVGLHLVGEVVHLGDQPWSALHLPAVGSIDALTGCSHTD